MSHPAEPERCFRTSTHGVVTGAATKESCDDHLAAIIDDQIGPSLHGVMVYKIRVKLHKRCDYRYPSALAAERDRQLSVDEPSAALWLATRQEQ